MWTDSGGRAENTHLGKPLAHRDWQTLDFVTIAALSLVLIPAVRQYSSPLSQSCTADNSLYLHTAPLKCSICLSCSIQLPLLQAVYLTLSLCSWFCFFSPPSLFLGWVFQKDCKFYGSIGKSGANPCHDEGNSAALSHAARTKKMFFSALCFTTCCVTSVVRVFFLFFSRWLFFLHTKHNFYFYFSCLRGLCKSHFF